MREDNRDGLFHWRNYYGLWDGILARRDGLNLKRLNDVFFFLQTHSFSLYKTLTDGLVSYGLL